MARKLTITQKQAMEIDRLEHLLKLVTDTVNRAQDHLIHGLTTEYTHGDSVNDMRNGLLAMRTEAMTMARHELSAVKVILSHQHVGPQPQ